MVSYKNDNEIENYKKEIDSLTSINTTITKVDGLNNSVVDTKLIPAPMYAPPLEVDVAGKLSSLILPPSPAQLSPLKQTNLKLSMSSPSLIQSPKRYLTVKEMEEEEMEEMSNAVLKHASASA